MHGRGGGNCADLERASGMDDNLIECTFACMNRLPSSSNRHILKSVINALMSERSPLVSFHVISCTEMLAVRTATVE